MSWTEKVMRLHRDVMDGMSDAERVVYLEEMLRGEISARSARIARCIDAIPGGAERLAAYLLVLLSDAPGRTLPYDFIAARMEELSGSHHSLASVSTAVKKARAAIRRTDWPVSIETVTAVGYRMTIRDGWAPPWTLPPPSAGLNRSHWIRSP